MVSGGQMDWQAVLHPSGLVYRARPSPAVTSILPIPVRNASWTTTALVTLDGPAGWIWAAAMPTVAAVEPPARTAATTARAAQDMLPPRRKVNLIYATASSSEEPPAALRSRTSAVAGSRLGRTGGKDGAESRSGRGSRGNRDRSGVLSPGCAKEGVRGTGGRSLYPLTRVRGRLGSRLNELGPPNPGRDPDAHSARPCAVKVGGVVEAADDPVLPGDHQPGDGPVVRGQERELPGPAGQRQCLPDHAAVGEDGQPLPGVRGGEPCDRGADPGRE